MHTNLYDYANVFAGVPQSRVDHYRNVFASTVYETAKGKESKKFTLERLNPGGSVTVIHEDGTASKVILKKGATKKKDA